MNIAFLYPDKNIGGAQLLFARLALAISNSYKNVSVFYIDYVDGFSLNWLKENKAKVEYIYYNIDSKENSIELPSNLTIILPFDKDSLDICRKKLLLNNTKFIFWFIEPSLLLPFFHSTRVAKVIGLRTTKYLTRVIYLQRFKKIKNLLLHSSKNSGLLFMDGENTKIPFFYFEDLKSALKLLQIPIELKEKRHYKSERNNLHIAWVGRLAYQKRGALSTIINDLEHLDSNLKSRITLHIIGDGPDFALIEKWLTNITYRTILHGSMQDYILRDFLTKKVDLLFAMGTSTLEGASLGVPTVLMDALSTDMSKIYKYDWLFNTIDFCLGSIQQTKHNRYSMSDIISSLELEENYQDLGNQSYYYSKRHSLDTVAGLLVENITNCSNLLKTSDFY